jgi:hypothetical protein
MAVAVITGGLDQPLNLGLGEVLARPDLGIRTPPGRALRRLNCPIKVLGVTNARRGFFIDFATFLMITVPLRSGSGGASESRQCRLAARKQN